MNFQQLIAETKALAEKFSQWKESRTFETKELSGFSARDGFALPPAASIKSIEGRTVTGIASVFGNVDDGLDRIHPGAFKKSIAEGRGRQKHFWNHGWDDPPIAIITNLREVTRDELPPSILQYAPEATGGLEVTREYLDVELANWVYQNIAKGTLEMSIGYDAISMGFTSEGEGANEKRIRELYEIRLWETSDVNFGMNSATQAAGKAAPPLEILAAHLQGWAEDVKAGRRNAANDLKLINAIHSAAVSLGCDECAGIATADEGGKSRAEQVSLTRYRSQMLELATLTM